MRANTRLAGALALGLCGAFAPASAPARDLVAVRAGTIHLVEDGVVLEGGATLLFQGSRILAVGTDVDVPPDARVVDYGPESVIVPGLVAPFSAFAQGRPADRTAEPGLSALDGFDFFAEWPRDLQGGVTSAYITPASGRLIAGTGAVVKLAGDDREARIVNASAAIQGAIDESARQTPGYWQPPIPATPDVGIGYLEPQLPRTTMGAVVALDELLRAAGAGDTTTPYGPYAGTDLARLLHAGVPWRIGAVEEEEIRALLGFRREHGVPLIIDKAFHAGDLAQEIAAAGASVVFHVPFLPNRDGQDWGKGRDDRWPSYDVPAALVAHGVHVAIASFRPRDLLFSAALASRGGLSTADALRAITLTPAELFGADERIGSLRAGKDADFVVLNGPPLSGQAGVLATWVSGEVAWDPAVLETAAAKRMARLAEETGRDEHAFRSPPTVVAVDQLFVGDGEVLSPGELLLEDGRIVEVGPSVSRPRGARVVKGAAAMPGMIDGLGFLGLEGSKKVPNADFHMSDIVAPGDRIDRRVAAAGVTTVVLSPRGAGRGGAPLMAYKPAAEDFERQVVGDPVALRVEWTDRDRLKSGAEVRELLQKAVEYRQKWLEYEEALAKWTPPPPSQEEAEPDQAEDEAASGDEADKKEDDDKAKDEDKDKDKKKKKKKGEEEPLEPDPVTGVWQAEIARPPRAEAAALKMRIELEGHAESGKVHGNLRCAAVSDDLVDVEGYWDREARRLDLAGLGTMGWISLGAKLEEHALVGKLTVAESELDLKAERTSKEYVVARRATRSEDEQPDEPKGKPRPPKRDDRLEPLRAAIEGRATVVVAVQREDEILDCVDAFAAAGIRPVLYGAQDAHYVLDRLVGRVAGVLLSPEVTVSDAMRGADDRTPYSELQAAGIPVAFHSEAEEGAADLPLIAAYAAAQGMSRAGALRALTADTARMFAIGDRVGRLAGGLDADVLLLDGPPLDPRTSVVRSWVNGVEVR